MACATCQSGSPNGCQNHGHCSTGGCNKLNTYDWLAGYEFDDPTGTDIIEVSFKKGARKEFFRNHPHNPAHPRDIVVVDMGSGYDIGTVSLTGELVRLQMKKRRVKEQSISYPVIRIANERDIERLNEYRALEHHTMVRARAIAASISLDMKICDVEYRGDGRKATFYYTAEGRIDFRELVRHYAKEFQVKVEMRQIGARQESSRIGGIGSCGRELCCSTWLTEFKSVNTHAARYQNLSINQAKLSGQCGRLKCCLNYELDTYMDALEEFPKDVDNLKFQGGKASVLKMDIFKRLIYYIVDSEKGRNQIVALPLDRVKHIKALNAQGQLADQLIDPKDAEEEEVTDFADVTGDIELPDPKRRKKKKKKGGKDQERPAGRDQQARQREPREGDTDKPREPREPREPGRRDGGERRDKPRQGGEQRRERPAREGENRGDRPPRPPRDQQARPPREDKPREDQGSASAGDDAQGSAPSGENRQGRSRRNKNRNRGRGNRPPQGDGTPPTPPAS